MKTFGSCHLVISGNAKMIDRHVRDFTDADDWDGEVFLLHL